MNRDSLVPSDKSTSCELCRCLISSKTSQIQTCCGHIFHKTCLSKSVKTRPYCPICNTRVVTESTTEGSTGVTTRSKASDLTSTEPSEVLSASFRGLSTPRQVEGDSVQAQPALVPTTHNTSSSDSPVSNPAVSIIQNEVLKDMITKIVSVQQAQLFSALNTQIASLIESNIQSSLARISPNIFNNVQPSHQPLQPPPPTNQTNSHMQTLPAVEQQTFREMLGIRHDNSSESPTHSRSNHSNAIPRPNSNNQRSALTSDLYVRPDKVLQTISNWKIKFSGSTNSLSVDSFIYRVEALTAQTLYGDYELLCNYAGSLFEGKATDWFWRFHQRDPSITWSKLCKALRE